MTLPKLLALAIIAWFVGACNQSDFSGSSKSTAPNPKSENAESEPTLGTETTPKPGKKKVEKEDEDEEDEDEGSIKPTDNPTVVTAGSFSAWAEPSAPALGQDYHIIIEVKLPKGVSNYTLADLEGELSGTDSYRQTIGTNPMKWNSMSPQVPIPLPEFVLSGRLARLRIRVPGANVPLTRDTVTIRSQLLDEQQALAIQFQ